MKPDMRALQKIGLLFICAAMLCINLFAWNFSTIGLMLIAGAVSLMLFLAGSKKGGAEK